MPCRAKLPAAVWRALANTERLRHVSEDVALVELDDSGEVVYLLSGSRYAQLITRVRELEELINGKGTKA